MGERLMKADELATIKARAAAATPGPWTAEPRDDVAARHLDGTDGQGGPHFLGWDVVGPPEASHRGQFARGHDAIFVADARTTVPRLLAMIDQLMAERERLITALDEAIPGVRSEVELIGDLVAAVPIIRQWAWDDASQELQADPETGLEAPAGTLAALAVAAGNYADAWEQARATPSMGMTNRGQEARQVLFDAVATMRGKARPAAGGAPTIAFVGGNGE